MSTLPLAALHNGTLSIGVIGLGYVGLPLAVAFSNRFAVVGFDVNAQRIAELAQGHDRTREVSAELLQKSPMSFTDDPEQLKRCDVLIVTVPTPIDAHCRPDLTALRLASESAGKSLKPGCVVVYESTVYPGVTEDICVPILERHSGLKLEHDFNVGYSPERINPGDSAHSLINVMKVVAGNNEDTRLFLAELYGTIIKAGIHQAPSIRVAEAAKAIENTQRDINIALMNELSGLFDALDIDTLDVLAAAATKWNFMPFSPGLVGGHCIGVDPYYLTYKAEEVGFMPRLISAGRRINDAMGKQVAERCVKLLIQAGGAVKGARVGILGLTFKENIPDLRNTRVVDIIKELEEYRVTCLIHDPFADPAEAKQLYGVELLPESALNDLDALIVAVPHAPYKTFTPERLGAFFRPQASPIVLDIKGIFDPLPLRKGGFTVWRL